MISNCFIHIIGQGEKKYRANILSRCDGCHGDIICVDKVLEKCPCVTGKGYFSGVKYRKYMVKFSI